MDHGRFSHFAPRLVAGILCTLASVGALAQAGAFADASVTRRERLLKDMRAPEKLTLLKSPAEEPAWKTECGLALDLSVAKHNERTFSTPVYCEASRGALTVGVDSDGFVAQDGSANARGVADFNVGGRVLTAVGTSKLTFSGGATWPSQSDVGSEHSDAYLGVTLAPKTGTEWAPSLDYTIQRNGDPQAAGGRSTQKLGVGAQYVWSETTVSAVGWSRAKPRSSAGGNVLALSHAFDIVSSWGLTGRLSASRAKGEWDAAASVRVGKTF